MDRHWTGRIEGIQAAGLVTADHMRHLFGSGSHPLTGEPLRPPYKSYSNEGVDGFNAEVGHWAARTARARNDLAHEGETPRHTLEEVVVIVEVTTAVVILNLLHELGLSADRQRELVREHPHLSTTAARATEMLAAPPTGA